MPSQPLSGALAKVPPETEHVSNAHLADLLQLLLFALQVSLELLELALETFFMALQHMHSILANGISAGRKPV